MFFCRRQRERVYWSLGINTPSQTVWSNGLYLLFLSSSSALPFHSLPLPHISCTRCTATAGIHSFFNPSLLVSAVYLQSFILNHCNPYSVVSMEVVLSISCFAVSDIIIWCQKQFVNIFLYFYWIIWFYCLYKLFFKNNAYFLFIFLLFAQFLCLFTFYTFLHFINILFIFAFIPQIIIASRTIIEHIMLQSIYLLITYIYPANYWKI